MNNLTTVLRTLRPERIPTPPLPSVTQRLASRLRATAQHLLGLRSPHGANATLASPEETPDLCDCCNETAMNCKCQGDWNEDRSICAYHSERRRIAREARHIAGSVLRVE